MSTTLYPLKFKPIYKEKIWGGNKLHTLLNKENSPQANYGESWEISAVQGDVSVVSNGFLAGNSLEETIEVYMGDLVGERIFEKYGQEFPLLIKFIDANDKLSVQVHPDDALAKKRHQAYGKTEMWYVLQADENAKLISGFSTKVDKASYLNKLNNKQLESILNFEGVQKGDVFFIPAGRVHAICSGILLAEIQQTSDVTYRIYDWDRTDNAGNSRELHTDLALEALDFKKYDTYKTDYVSAVNKTARLAQSKYFSTNVLEFENIIERDYALLDSFVIYICVEGAFDILYDTETEQVTTGESILLPAIFDQVRLVPKTKAKLIEVYIEDLKD